MGFFMPKYLSSERLVNNEFTIAWGILAHKTNPKYLVIYDPSAAVFHEKTDLGANDLPTEQKRMLQVVYGYGTRWLKHPGSEPLKIFVVVKEKPYNTGNCQLVIDWICSIMENGVPQSFNSPDYKAVSKEVLESILNESS
ncbi:hypothetical protein NHQ30_009664 [Ciborinia camelliae]|nr:hypothetical protein NHQ30_009664 [Ciborinia camelliae]